tara:strand:+ start:9042 stop:10565 length:1524 start_codon:yes stop_codon:yes gene_type:complete
MGLPFTNNFEFSENEVTRHIQSLYEEMNREGRDMQTDIDRHWVALMMIYVKSPLLDALPWQYFVLNVKDVLVHDLLPDIGRHVRMLSMREENNDVMCRMIQYSLPYIKHNRLTFAKFEEVDTTLLVNLIQILLAMCLGLHSNTCKKPVWRLRFRLISYVYTLFATGSSYDLYLFCMNNLNLIRISLVEYFVYYVQRFMPCEYEMLQNLFGMQTNIEGVCTQFQININCFRSNHMQTDVLLWRDLNAKAHVIIEKCNRICKGKPRMTGRRHKTKDPYANSDDATIQMALSMSSIEPIALARYQECRPNIDALSMIDILRDTIKIHILPRNVVQSQCLKLHKALHKDTVVYSHSIFLYQCLRCRSTLSLGKMNSRLRTDSNGCVSCCNCSSHESIVKICVLGRVVEIFDYKFYFCHFCMGVHQWMGTGHEFTRCCMQPVKTRPPVKQCKLCQRVHNLQEMSVLDDVLGIRQTFYLCGRHMPLPYQQHLIYNFETLNKSIEYKMKHFVNI